MKKGMKSNTWEVHHVRLAVALEERAKGRTFAHIANKLNLPTKDMARSLCAKAARRARLPQTVIQHRSRSQWSALPASDLRWSDYLSIPTCEVAKILTRLNNSAHWQTRLFEHRIKP